MNNNKNVVVEKAINFLLNILIFMFSIFLLISVYIGFQTRIIGNDYANFFGYSLFEVQSGSMEDEIKIGDWIVVKLTKNVDFNDIITFELDGEFVTHRIVEVYKGTFVTQGDANNKKDDPIDQSQVVGKVVKVLGGFGIIRKTLFNPIVLLSLIITLLLFNFAFKSNKISINNELINNLLESLGNFIENITNKFNKLLNKDEINESFFEKQNLNSGFMSIEKQDDFFETKEYEKLEEELSKTALYRVVTVDKDNVKEDFKVLTPQKKTVEQIEEDLSKTSLYRIISANTEDVPNKYKNTDVKVSSKTQTQKYAEIEDELGKTSIFRVISVDNEEGENEKQEKISETSLHRFVSVNNNETDKTISEIAKHEIKEEQKPENVKINQEDKEITKVEKEDDEHTKEEGLTDINLELLKSKNSRRGKNIIDKTMIIKKEELDELIDILVKDDPTYVYRARVKDRFIISYTDAKYYNYYGAVEIETRGRNLTSRIKVIIKILTEDIIKEYKGKDKNYHEIIEKYLKLFTLIADLEQARDSATTVTAKKKLYSKYLNDYFGNVKQSEINNLIDEIMDVQQRYLDTINYFLDQLKTNAFVLTQNKIVGARNMFGLSLEHNITFSKVYSDYIIDKTYTEGIVAEDKVSVLLSLLSVQLVDDMLNANFDNKYVVHIPVSLYGKKRKLASTLRLIDNEYAKSNIIILIEYKDLLKNRQVVKEYKKSGYRFGLTFHKNDNLLKKDHSLLYIVNCFFINRRTNDMKKIILSIPEELSDKIISDDVITKVGDFGGEST